MPGSEVAGGRVCLIAWGSAQTERNAFNGGTVRLRVLVTQSYLGANGLILFCPAIGTTCRAKGVKG